MDDTQIYVLGFILMAYLIDECRQQKPLPNILANVIRMSVWRESF
jgi:hypothetical protein